MLERGNCRNCKRDYRSVLSDHISIYQNSDGKWCSTCSGCQKEQAYTRKDHAKQSELNDWQCHQCVANAKGFSNNRPVGARKKLFNKFMQSAENRGLKWELTLDQMFEGYDGHCALTGWTLSVDGAKPTAILDRIDSSIGYVKDNVQWVHSMVNMSKNKYDQDLFIKMCLDIANRKTRSAQSSEPKEQNK